MDDCFRFPTLATLLAFFAIVIAPGDAAANTDLDTCFSLNAATIRDQAVQSILKSACSRVIETKSMHRADRARAYLQRGLINLAQKNGRAAYSDCKSAIRLGQSSRQVLRCSANAKLALPARKKSEKPIDESQEAAAPVQIAKSSKKCIALAASVEARGAAGDIDRPIETLDQLVDCQPESTTHRLNRGQYYLEQKNNELALRDFDKCLEIDKLEEDCRYMRGVARFRADDIEGAIEDLERVGPDYPYAKIQLDKAREARRQKSANSSSLQSGGESATEDVRAAGSQNSGGNAEKIAMVIGMANYQSPEWDDLGNAARDANQIAHLLSQNGFRVTLLLDAKKTTLESTIDEFAASAAGANVAFIWYAGHGARVRIDELVSDSFLLPADFPSKGEPTKDGIPLQDLLRSLSRAKTLRVAAIDACRNLPALTERIVKIEPVLQGTRSVSTAIRRGKVPLWRSVATTRGFNLELNESFVSYSTSGGSVALDGPPGGNSPYAAAFLQAFEADPGLDIRQFFSGVARRTKASTKNTQTPENIDRLANENLLSLK